MNAQLQESMQAVEHNWLVKYNREQDRFITEHYTAALSHGVIPLKTTRTQYVTDHYAKPGSILPELFRYRFEKGLIAKL